MSAWHKALREPLLHFVVAGAVLFLVGHAIHGRSDAARRIEITPQRAAQLANRYTLQFGAPPDPAMMNELIHGEVHDEILFREGLAMGLDKDDEIVRRRIIQKMQFLLEDLQVPPEPDAAQLQAYYRNHATQYRLPSRATFSHIYFGLDRGDASARSRAQAVLTTLQRSASSFPPERAPNLGDPFPDLYDFADCSPSQLEHLFGPTDFTTRVFSVPTGKWAGPFKSAFGWHLIYVQSRAPAREQPFTTVRDRVRTDYLLDSQKRANDAAFTALARQFTASRH